MKKTIKVNETKGFDRKKEPVTIGFPFAKGEVKENDPVSLTSSNGMVVSLQACPLSYWSDKSVKWALLDFQADVESNATEIFKVTKLNEDQKNDAVIEISKKENEYIVNTGNTEFFIGTEKLKLFDKVFVDGESICEGAESKIILLDINGIEYEPIIEQIIVEVQGSVRSVIKVEGFFGSSKKTIVKFYSRLHFYANKSSVRIDFTLWNDLPAKHPGGLWDLGDPGSVLFKDLSIYTGIVKGSNPEVLWCSDPWLEKNNYKSETFTVYQGSSGGENWQSRNHINRDGEIPVTQQGYVVENDGELFSKGLRTEPVVHLENSRTSISCCIRKFWQNFPKSIDIEGSSVVARLFPERFGDLYELQGGERKTTSVFLHFGDDTNACDSFLRPVEAIIPPDYYKYTSVFSYFTTTPGSWDDNYEKLINAAIEGENSFFNRREIIDEFGWRNFGEIYADHEAVGYEGEGPLISHYNNQYDIIHSTAVQFAMKGDSRWFELMDDLARHVSDIDIYHTYKDRLEYNGGLFWHTNHYLDASTCTHRSESAKHLEYSDPQFCGGGPALEHCYTSGLLAHYFMTGDANSKAAVLSLAEWVIAMMSKPETILSFVFMLKSKIGIWKRVFGGAIIRNYSYPFTRETGNCITALLDAYTLTSERKYIEKAEEQIRGCVHPGDDIEIRDLFNTELNWSYTACLQGIGKYLDFKENLGELDEMFFYAKDALIHYAKWMLVNEFPYLDKADTLEFPNETWPAQDIRKSCVFYYATKYSDGDIREQFLEKAKFYYEYSLMKVAEFDTSDLTRPIALLLQNGVQYSYFSAKNDNVAFESNFVKSDHSYGKNILSRWGIVKYLLQTIRKLLLQFSFVKEYRWLKARLNKHI